MFKFKQFEAYNQGKKFLLYAEKIAERQIQKDDEVLAHKIKSSLVTIVANIAHMHSYENDEESKNEMLKATKALIHEVAASFDIAHDKRLVNDETFDKLQEKINNLLLALNK